MGRFGSHRRYKGVAITSREPLKDLHFVDPLAPWAGLVAAQVNGLSLVGVYGPGSASHVDDKLIKGAWWDALLVVSDSWRGGPCAIVGDFNNGVRGLDEIGQTFACSDKFLELPAHGFRDAWRQRHGDQAREWSWWSRQGGGYRLDHCFVTDDVEVDFVSYEHRCGAQMLVRLPGEPDTPRALSDHAALVVDLTLRDSATRSPADDRVRSQSTRCPTGPPDGVPGPMPLADRVLKAQPQVAAAQDPPEAVNTPSASHSLLHIIICDLTAGKDIRHLDACSVAEGLAEHLRISGVDAVATAETVDPEWTQHPLRMTSVGDIEARDAAMDRFVWRAGDVTIPRSPPPRSDDGNVAAGGQATVPAPSVGPGISDVGGLAATASNPPITEVSAGAAPGSWSGPPVGQIEIAELLNVPLNTVHKWIQRDLLPSANYASINGSRAWDRRTILGWAGSTGRISPSSVLVDEYRRIFNSEVLPQRKGGPIPETNR